MDKLIQDQKLFTTSASLMESVDKRVLVVLRDGKKLLGILRTYDQFANLVLQDTVERVYVDSGYGDIERGVFVVRGENVVLLGEVDEDLEDGLPLQELPIEPILSAQRTETEKLRQVDKIKNHALKSRGFSVDYVDTDTY